VPLSRTRFATRDLVINVNINVNINEAIPIAA
jgi:hypothetical protein